MSAVGTVTARGPLNHWRTLDIVTAPVLGVAFGIVFWGWDFAYNALSVLFTAAAPLQGLANGGWLIGGVVGALVVRRPGAALFVELLASFVEMALGNQWGTATLISGVLQGLGVEIVFAAFVFRRFGTGVAMAAGAMAAVFEIAGYEWWSYWVGYSWSFKLVYLAGGAVSGALLAGLLGSALVRALSRAGALDRFPPGVELHRSRPATS